MKKVLTIAGFDPTGGAGLQADLRVFQKMGLIGLSAVTATTAQNTVGVRHVMPVAPSDLRRQLDVLLEDLRPDAVKLGMLATAANLRVVASAIRRHALANVVLDPVLVSSSGRPLIEKRAIPEMVRCLIPLCRVITPNVPEAATLSGNRRKRDNDLRRIAETLRSMGPECVIITGGHRSGDADDLVLTETFHRLRGRRVEGEFHGTGCHFAAAMAASLAMGLDPLSAAKLAKRFMTSLILHAERPGKGMKLL